MSKGTASKCCARQSASSEDAEVIVCSTPISVRNVSFAVMARWHSCRPLFYMFVLRVNSVFSEQFSGAADW